MSPIKIAVIGATGLIGEPVTREFLAAGLDVTIIARNPEKANQLFPGSPVRKADVFSSEEMKQALTGLDMVYISLSPTRTARQSTPMAEREGLKNILQAAGSTGIKRVLLLSSLVQRYNSMDGFDWWIFRMKEEAVRMVKASGIPYSIFYPSTFMETMGRDMIRGNRIMLVSGTRAKMWFIAGSDYGRQIVRAIAIAGNQNQEYTIQGTEAFDWNEAARVVQDHYYRPMKILTAPIGMLKLFSPFIGMMNYAAHICEALNKYPEKFESEKTWLDLGMPGIRLADFVKSLKAPA